MNVTEKRPVVVARSRVSNKYPRGSVGAPTESFRMTPG